MMKRCIIEHLVEHILELQKDKGELTDKCKELEKKNAELKETYKKQRNRRIDELQKKNAELIKKDENLQKYLDSRNCYRECAETWLKLTDAKKLLRQFLDAKSIEETCIAESEATRFLKETENAVTRGFEHD